jgi:DNA phosphorothioation-dependent restriction protein DptF
MKLRKMLDTLSRSSAQAVRTLENKHSAADGVKDYLYVETPIEHNFRRALEGVHSPDQIIFLCGSSGDGKSEILARYYERYKVHIHFHLDATHSYQPDRNAIQTLDEVFSKHKRSSKPLVVGINVGMLANYAEEGHEEHDDIIHSIRSYLEGEDAAHNHNFINFEDFPKFEPFANTFVSTFIKNLLQKLTVATEDNPFFISYQEAVKDSEDRLLSNYRLLQFQEVQEVIIQTLLKVHLKYDQFLTARAILDLIYHLLSGPGYLFDNLFTSHSSDLTTALTHFDPCTTRSREIDLFLIQASLGIQDEDFEMFKQALRSWLNPDELTPGSWIRLFYLLQDIDTGNNYHQRFRQDFRNDLFEEYITIWLLHYYYRGDQEQRRRLRAFYNKLNAALFRFANRYVPELSNKRRLFLGDYNGYILSTPTEIEVNLSRIPAYRPTRLGDFNACLRLGDEDLPPIPISANFLELILKINKGYRPNKHDKNTIVILEEVLSDINRKVRDSNRLHISKGRENWTLINENDEEIIVEG